MAQKTPARRKHTTIDKQNRSVAGGFVAIEGESFYKIANVDRMPPFLMSLVSGSDHWMFVSSNGALTAGRRDPDHALFPYVTDDKIHDSAEVTGSRTILRVAAGGRSRVWEPFSVRGEGAFRTERNLYKNGTGNKLIFEEVNLDLRLVFRTAWMTGEKFGFIKHSLLANLGRREARVEVLDGVQNVLPDGVGRRFQLEYSTLADGYKKNELVGGTGLGLFTLSSVPTDKAEPSEALRATTVWCAGLDRPKHLLSVSQLGAFRHGLPVHPERDIRGVRGAYFAVSRLSLKPSTGREWFFAADVGRDAADVTDLARLLGGASDLRALLLADVNEGTTGLRTVVAAADGLQATSDRLVSARHFSNALFNVMRGGIPDGGTSIRSEDFRAFVEKANRPLAAERAGFLDSLPERLPHSDLLSRAGASGDPDLERLAFEYLPLTFSRRHGDPSRPWNLFSIGVKDGQGRKVLNYQGNWRDLFQNWEALALSYPGYIESMIAKFVDASTADGYNPYRVTRDGFEWEVLDPHDPWSYIGYWGDHQIVYLLRLLEWSDRFHPGRLADLLRRNFHTYADVPYRIRPYADLLRDPRDTIRFDAERDREVRERVRAAGEDGKFLHDRLGRRVRVTLAEKLIVPVLAKLANFIPEAGIWMNTQRPEWNDANNALVGAGVSVVTLCHLRRYLSFFRGLLDRSGPEAVPLTPEVSGWLDATRAVLERLASVPDGPLTDGLRRGILDGFGGAADAYRARLYAGGLSEDRRERSAVELASFCGLALRAVERSIRANRRPDGLYHAYNLMSVEPGGGIAIRRLYEMLEGQAAVLGSGLLDGRERAAILDALRGSALYRKDQASYLLYPDRRLTRFTEKNNIPEEAVRGSEFLRRCVADGDGRIVRRDSTGVLHFNGDFRNASILRRALEGLDGPGWRELAAKETPFLLALYETMFDHGSFTGRSGTFYKYEGLGCIYWHMVSKLCLAAQEAVLDAVRSGEDGPLTRRLRDRYREIREGLGVHKAPDRYGAFPTDPYSHTPGFAGVQQPGMTGQVKEDILARFADLGIRIADGELSFGTDLLDWDEFLKKPEAFATIGADGQPATLDLSAGNLAFTFCQVPVVLWRSKEEKIRITLRDGGEIETAGRTLDSEWSSAVFERTGEVVRLDVHLTGPRQAGPKK
jgi:hypothetical protein